jgi:hypothetical protein
MHKKTIIGVAIATILIAYLSALTMSNQALAQGTNRNNANIFGGLEAQLGNNHVLAGQEAHVGQVLGGISTTIHHILKGGTTTGLGAMPVKPSECELLGLPQVNSLQIGKISSPEGQVCSSIVDL